MKRNAQKSAAFLATGLLICAVCCAEEMRAAPEIPNEPLAEEKSAPEELNEELIPYIDYLNEFSERRRMNVYFHNDQPHDRGAQAGYVNVGRGNFTFLRRDLVTVGRIPLVLARAYDSSLPEEGDFGPGWHLTAAESIHIEDDGSLWLTDESGASVRYLPSRKGYVAAVPGPSEVRHILALGDERLRVSLQSGWSKDYTLIEGRHRLTRVEDRWGNSLELSYDQGRLVRLRGGNGRFIALQRDESGRVTSAADDQGRRVSYRYDSQGRLSESVDLGGLTWSYRYDEGDRLSQALDPMGQYGFLALYDEQGRAIEVDSGGQLYRYHYQAGRTLVTDGNEAACLYSQNADGITLGISNSLDVRTRVELDERNWPKTLYRNGELLAEISHDRRGRPVVLTLYEGGKPQQLVYGYDKMGRLTRVSGGRDSYGWGVRDLLRLTYDRTGNLLQRIDENGRTAYSYTPQGDLESVVFESGLQAHFKHDADGQVILVSDAHGRQTRFAYHPDGKLAETTFADGSQHSYSYDSLGMRTHRRMRKGDEDLGSVEFTPNATGSLINTLVTHPDGHSSGHRLILDEEQKIARIEYSSGHATDLEYDSMGNLVTARSDDMFVRFSYDRLNRLVDVLTAEDERLSYSYRQGEPDIRVQLDDKTGVRASAQASVGRTFGSGMDILRDHSRRSYLGVIDLSGSALEFRLASAHGSVPEGHAAASAVQRMRMLELGLANEAVKDRFELPSNIFFHPAEYRAINCCIDCDVYGICPPCRPIPPFTCPCGTHCDCIPIILRCAFSIDLTSPQNFRINTTPTMPTINARATNIFPSAGSTAIGWTAKIDYRSQGTSCSGGPDFNSPIIAGQGTSFSPVFSGFFGDNLSVGATCSSPGFLNSSRTASEDIRADNPSRATIRGAIGNLGAPFDAADLKRVACVESNQRQFLNGLPFLGGGGDVGIMQICFQRQTQHFWNWRNNVASGRARLTGDSLNFANSVPRRVRTQTVRGAGPFPSATNFTNAQKRREAIHAYNAGTNINTDGYWRWNNSMMQWVAAPQGGQPGYAANVLGTNPNCP